MQRLLTRTSLILAAVVAVVGGAAVPASATPFDPKHQLIASGKVYLVNDEPLWQDHDTDWHTLDGKFLDQPSSKTMDWTPCQGGEVTAWVQVGAEHLGRGRLRVRVGLLLEEGTKCKHDFFDSGELKESVFVLGPNEDREVELTAHNHRNLASHDRADLTINVTNRCTIFFMQRCAG